MVRIPEHSELEIDSVISRQNVAKEGWTTYYVDGTNGNDANNGLRWETAFKTIQHAVDVAESWAKIFIKNGTYSENIIITKNNISLIGESRTDTIISPDDGEAIFLEADNILLTSLKIIGAAPASAVRASGNHNKVISCDYSRRVVLEGDFCIAKDLYSSTHGILISHNRNIVTKCIIENAFEGITIDDGKGDSSQFNLVIGNEILNATTGIYISKLLVESKYNFIANNNIINCTTSVKDDGSDNIWLENYYSDHSNIDNGFGIATEPYVFTGGSDPRPVVCRNGWLVLGHGGNTIKSVPVEGTYTHPDDTTEHDVLEFSAATQDIHISLDVSALTQPVEIREYEKIDGTNYRQIALKTYPDDFDTGTDAITIFFKQKNKDYKVTFKSTAAEGASRSIPYVYRTDGKV